VWVRKKLSEPTIAIRPKTGERVWYFQATPQDPFDFDAVSQPVIATITVGGSPHKVVIQANRNGFLYVLDAKDGKLIAAKIPGAKLVLLPQASHIFTSDQPAASQQAILDFLHAHSGTVHHAQA